jgi:hypothetical protein
VVVPADLRHGVDQAVGRVVDRGAGDAEREDVAAPVELLLRNGSADVLAPDQLAGGPADRVQAVVLGRGDHVVADD